MSQVSCGKFGLMAMVVDERFEFVEGVADGVWRGSVEGKGEP